MSISLFRSLAGQYEHLREVNTVSMMNTISHHIEDQVINHRLPVEFYAGFQRFSLFPDQLRRYQKLGAVCRRVYVFGVPDTRPPSIPGVEYVSLDPSSPLAKEWFVVVNTPEFWTILATQEVDGVDAITGGRRFDGLWTFDAEVVERATLLISQTLGNFYKPVSDRKFESQNQHITEISTRMINDLEASRIQKKRWRSRVGALQQMSDKLASVGDFNSLLDDTANVLHSIFGASGVTITLYDQGQQLTVVAAQGEATVKIPSVHSGKGLLPQAVAQQQMLYIADTRKSQGDPYLPTAQSLVIAPIIGKTGVHGALAVGGNQADQWKQEDGETIMSLATMLAVGLERQTVPAGNALANTDQWQAPMAYLMMLHQKLRRETAIAANQSAMLDQIDKLTTGLAHAIGVPAETIRRIMGE